MSALNEQVGGEHYRKLAIQPAEYTTRNGIGHLAGDCIAYVTRYKDKGGKQDLEKAIHCLQLLIEMEYPSSKRSPEEILQIAIRNHHKKRHGQFKKDSAKRK